MTSSRGLTVVAGFLILFFVYHFPEFFPVFWVMAVFKIGFLAVAFFLARSQGLKGLAGYGLGLTSSWGKHLSFGLVLGICFFSLSTILAVLLGYETITAVSAATIAARLPMIFFMTAFPSIAEDILTRGYFLAHLRMRNNRVFWVLFSACIYVLNHIWRLDDGAAVLSYLFILGVVLAFSVVMVESLWLAFGIHWGANIAFEISNPIVQETELAGDASTWVLAGCWALLFLLLWVVDRRGSRPAKAVNTTP